MVNKRKKYNARFAPARIKKIMQKDEEIGKVAAAVPVIISRALELFVQSLVRKAEGVTRSRNARTLTPAHLKASIQADPRLHFLREAVANIPDVNQEDEGESSGSTHSTPHGAASPPTKPQPRSRPPSSGTRRNNGESSESSSEQNPSANESDAYNMLPSYIPPPVPAPPPQFGMGVFPPQTHSQYPSPYSSQTSHNSSYQQTNFTTNIPSSYGVFGNTYPMTPAVPCQGEDDDYDT